MLQGAKLAGKTMSFLHYFKTDHVHHPLIYVRTSAMTFCPELPKAICYFEIKKQVCKTNEKSP